MFYGWNQMEWPREFSAYHEENVNSLRTFSMAFHDAQILSLPNMFLQWDRGGPRPWPEDCCRIGLSRIEDSDSIIPCVFIGIMWRSLETDENFRKSHLHSMMFLFFIIIFPGLPRSWLESGWTAAVWLHRLRFSWNSEDSLGEFRIL